jgi:hypothetical protein
VGRNMVFGEGEYMPGTNAGRRLLAHELTHIIQQWGVKRKGNGVKREGDQESRIQSKLRISSTSKYIKIHLKSHKLYVKQDKEIIKTMDIIVGQASPSLLAGKKIKKWNIGKWGEGFHLDPAIAPVYHPCTWFPWGKELDRIPGETWYIKKGKKIFKPEVGIHLIKPPMAKSQKRYRVQVFPSGNIRFEKRKGEWYDFDQYCNPFGKYQTTIVKKFMLHGNSGELGTVPSISDQHRRLSEFHGCIRTNNVDIEWLRKNVKRGSSLYVMNL